MEKLKGRNHMKNLSVDGKINIRMDIGETVGRCGLDASGSG
jgi:hypothetical protein